MTTPPRDLTAERAAAERLVNEIYGNAAGRCMGPIWEEYVIATEQLIKQTRQEALREAARVVRDWPWEQPLVHADPLRQARCRGNREASVDIADALDRLASEGGS